MDGTAFGRYRLLASLGEGPTGRVFRAVDGEGEGFVAIKVVSAELSSDEVFARRFLQHVKMAARLREANVIAIYDFGTIDGRLYVVMELCDGDLSGVLKAGPLTPERTVRILTRVAEALDAAHGIGLVHGDLKPSNVLLGEDDAAYLSDFGCHTEPDAYAAPELTTGGGSAASDVYSLARIAQDCLGSRGAPSDIDAVLTKGTDADPEARYRCASAFAEAAAAALGLPTIVPVVDVDETPTGDRDSDDETPADVPPDDTPARPWWRRHLVGITAAVAVAVTAASVTAIVAGAKRAPADPLLTVAEVNSITGSDRMVLVDRIEAPVSDVGSGTTTPVECTTLASFGDEATYVGFPFDWMANSYMWDLGADATRSVWQTVVDMESGEHASEYFAKSSRDWRKCDGQSFAVGESKYAMDSFDRDGRLITAKFAVEGGNRPCQRATAVKGRRIIELFACGPGVAENSAKTMATRLMDRA